MSIKKKQPIIHNPISRKKLFQFLFKNYIKSAYCGISNFQPAASAPHGGSAIIVVNKKELRTEYFNDMSECFNESQRSRKDYVRLQRKIIHRNGSVVIAKNSR